MGTSFQAVAHLASKLIDGTAMYACNASYVSLGSALEQRSRTNAGRRRLAATGPLDKELVKGVVDDIVARAVMSGTAKFVTPEAKAGIVDAVSNAVETIADTAATGTALAVELAKMNEVVGANLTEMVDLVIAGGVSLTDFRSATTVGAIQSTLQATTIRGAVNVAVPPPPPSPPPSPPPNPPPPPPSPPPSPPPPPPVTEPLLNDDEVIAVGAAAPAGVLIFASALVIYLRARRARKRSVESDFLDVGADDGTGEGAEAAGRGRQRTQMSEDLLRRFNPIFRSSRTARLAGLGAEDPGPSGGVPQGSPGRTRGEMLASLGRTTLREQYSARSQGSSLGEADSPRLMDQV